MKPQASCPRCPGAPATRRPTPGQRALRYRIGTHQTFLAAMLRRLSLGTAPELRGLTTREPDDLSIALLDAWATVADVLAFYQERIANEGYLRTATERHSLTELARLVGYRPRPGVAASTYLAFILEDAYATSIPAGTRVQSQPDPGALPQTFETSAPLADARARWNSMRPRLSRPLDLTPDSAYTVDEIYLAGVATRLKPNDPLLFIAGKPATYVVRWVRTVEPQPAAQRTRVTLQAATAPAAADKKIGPPLHPIFQPTRRPPDSRPALTEPWQPVVENLDLAGRVAQAFEPILRTTLNPALEGGEPPPAGWIEAFRVRAAPFGAGVPPRPIYDERHRIIGSAEWPVAGSTALRLRLAGTALTKAAPDWVTGGKVQAWVDLAADGQAHSLSLELGGQAEQPLKLGPSAGRISLALGDPPADQPANAPIRTLTCELAGQAISLTRADGMLGVVFDSQPTVKHSIAPGQRLQLMLGATSATLALAAEGDTLTIEREAPAGLSAALRQQVAIDAAHDQIAPGSHVLLLRADCAAEQGPTVATVRAIQLATRNTYGIAGQVAELTLERQAGSEWLAASDRTTAALRATTVYAQSEQLTLAELPIDILDHPAPVQGDSIELAGHYPDLEPGRLLIVAGERADLPGVRGVAASEPVLLANTSRERGAADDLSGHAAPAGVPHTTLHLASPLTHSYRPASVTIYGNVVPATQGETHSEVLGSGDAGALQRFTLKQAPLTYVAAPAPGGVASTLEVFVDGVRWREQASLVNAAPTDHVYTTSADSAGATSVIFGDGQHGARLPSGSENASASYRAGMGASGNLRPGQVNQLVSRPLGLKEALNPVAASGGADRDSAEDLRRNAPLGVQNLGRLVAAADYAAFARTFAGIGKASAQQAGGTSQGATLLTIAGIGDQPIDPDSDLLHNLVAAIERLRAGSQPFRVELRTLLLLVLSANVGIDPAYQWPLVEQAIRARLLHGFGFEQRELGQPVRLAEVIGAIQAVPGVAYVDVDRFTTLPEIKNAGPAQINKQLEELTAGTKQLIEVKLDPTDKSGQLLPAQIAYFDPRLPELLILQEASNERKH